ncbi:Glucose-1-phosphate thymidylyltransferase [compost metagenome]
MFLDDLTPFVNKFSRQAESSARLLLKWVNDPRRYGVAVFDPDDSNKIAYIEEKPKAPKTQYAVTGIYMYDHAVFNIIEGIHPSKRGELEITDVNNEYARDGRLEYDVLQLWWGDAGTMESLKEASIQMRGVLP